MLHLYCRGLQLAIIHDWEKTRWRHKKFSCIHFLDYEWYVQYGIMYAYSLCFNGIFFWSYCRLIYWSVMSPVVGCWWGFSKRGSRSTFIAIMLFVIIVYSLWDSIKNHGIPTCSQEVALGMQNQQLCRFGFVKMLDMCGFDHLFTVMLWNHPSGWNGFPNDNNPPKFIKNTPFTKNKIENKICTGDRKKWLLNLHPKVTLKTRYWSQKMCIVKKWDPIIA